MTFLRVLALFAVLAGPVHADPVEAVRAAEAEVASAQAALAASRGDRDRLRAYARVVLAYEAALRAARGGVAALGEAEAAAGRRADAARARADAVSVALMRLESTPPSLAHRHPGGLAAAGQARAVLAALHSPALDALRDRSVALGEVSTRRALHAAALDEMAAAVRSVRDARAAMLAAADARRGPSRAELADQLDALGTTGLSLSALAEALAGTGLDPAPAPVGSLEPGMLDWPVTGTLTTGFEVAGPDGTARPGVVATVDAGALVTAPGAAMVAYAGPFLDDRLAVVLRFGTDGLMALSGLGQLTVTAGQTVAAGDPLGLVGGADAIDEEFLIEVGASVSAFPTDTLYIELRLDGIATDPMPYFRSGSGQER